ncbi:MAG: hypothetical protein IKB24_00395, partial [Alistipes sp.]|nr:hypothetical protein [Alistipes sp.]
YKALDRLQSLEILRYTQDDKKESREQNRVVILNEVKNLAGCKALDRLQDLEILRYTQDDKKESREQNRVVILNEVKNLAGCKP